MMNRVISFAALGLAVLSLAVALSGPREVAVSPSRDERPSSGSSQDTQALEKRVKALEDTVVSLSGRLMALERRPAASEGSGGAVAGTAPVALSQEVEQLKAEMRGLIAGEALNSQGGREYLKEMVRSVQDEMWTAQRQERQQQWVQAQTQAQAERSERLRKFVSEAGLSYSQEQEFIRRMQGEEARRQTLVDGLSSGSTSPRDMRQGLRTMRTETDKAMQQLLSEPQRAKYEELRREEQRGQRRPGAGRPGSP